jgi:hypothetical protein
MARFTFVSLATLGTGPTAAATLHLSLHLELAGFTSVHLFHGNLHLVVDVVSLAFTSAAASTASAAHTEKVREDVAGVAAMSAAHAAIFDGLFAVLIVDGTLLRITEDFVCFVDFLELFLVTTCGV